MEEFKKYPLFLLLFYIMRKFIFIFSLALLCLSCSNFSKKEETHSFKVLQFNIWQEGTIVPGGYDGIVDQIIASGADFITLSEVRNYQDTRFCDRLVESLKEKGEIFYSFYSYDSGLLSRYPIIDSTTVYPCVNDHGSAYRALINMNGQEVALYTTHLDYLNCTYYDVKGYDGSSWVKRPPMTNLDSILANNVLSLRDDGMKAILEKAKEDRANNRIVLIGGDFNEPSHLDWTEETKYMFGRQGVIVPWTVSIMLATEGYVDAYREFYPNPVTHPGITYPSDNELMPTNKLSWTPEADERERIDFIYYAPFPKLKVTDAVIWGLDGSIERNERVKEETQDVFSIGEGVWPSDHKGVLITFSF